MHRKGTVTKQNGVSDKRDTCNQCSKTEMISNSEESKKLFFRYTIPVTSYLAPAPTLDHEKK
jgi:hypothetical protein